MFVFMYYLYGKYYKPIIEQNDTVECISWVPRLTLLDLQTGFNKCALGMELACMRGT